MRPFKQNLVRQLWITFFIVGVAFSSKSTHCAVREKEKENINLSAEPITSQRCNQFTFDAAGSYDPDKENLSYFWDFGDGQTSTEAVVDHTYTKSGDYDVTLTITDNTTLECSSSIKTQKIRTNIHPAAAFTSADMICVNEPIVFDADDSSDDLATNLGYEWNFGDGTQSSDGHQATKIYSKGGTYKVTLTVDDQSQTVCSTDSADKVIYVNEPPVAEAGEETLLKCVTDESELTVDFDASNSFDINNDTLVYYWDFGDGQKGEGKKVSHSYSQLGNYDVKLVVQDNTSLGCRTGVDFVTVKFNQAPRAEAGEDISVCPGEEVVFEGENVRDFKKGTVKAQWSFGDEESVPGFKAVHRYQKTGKYQASLSIENELNEMCPPSRDSRVVTVNSVPSVSIMSAESVCLGNKVNFDASSASDPDGDSLEYYWSFGDGSVLRSGPKVTHEYKVGGSYRVSVIVDDTRETACSTATATTTVKVNTPPIADAGPNLSCCVERNTEFNASASTDPDGDSLTYTWDFGDGTQASGAVTHHTYSKSGSYNVTLTVDDHSDTACSKSTSGFIAQANASPVPVINIR